MGRHPTESPGVPVRLPVIIAGDAEKAAQYFGTTLSQYVVEATQQRIVRDRLTVGADKFAKAEAEAQRLNQPRPDPTKYGLPADYGIEAEPAERAAKQAAKPASAAMRPPLRSADQKTGASGFQSFRS